MESVHDLSRRKAMNTNISNSINKYLQNSNIGKNLTVKGKAKSEAKDIASKKDVKNTVFGTGVGSSASVEFSPEVEMFGKVVDMLQKKYENADIFVAGPDDDLSQIGGDLEYSIILSEDEMKLLASDDEKDKKAKDKLLKNIDDAMNKISDLSKKIEENTGDDDEISNFGISIGKDGKVNFFADINGQSFKDTSVDSLLKSIVSSKA
jgi:hypothetical protein